LLAAKLRNYSELSKKRKERNKILTAGDILFVSWESINKEKA